MGITQHQKGYLVYVPYKRNIISLYDLVFDENVFSALAYMSQLYVEAMAMQPPVSYKPYATSSKEKIDNMIMFTQFEEGNLLSKSHDGTESGDKSYDSVEDSTLPPLISETEMDEMLSGNESDPLNMPTDML